MAPHRSYLSRTDNLRSTAPGQSDRSRHSSSFDRLNEGKLARFGKEQTNRIVKAATEPDAQAIGWQDQGLGIDQLDVPKPELFDVPFTNRSRNVAGVHRLPD